MQIEFESVQFGVCVWPKCNAVVSFSSKCMCKTYEGWSKSNIPDAIKS